MAIERNYDGITKIVAKARSMGEPWPFAVAAMVQALVVRAMSPCPRQYAKGAIGYNREGKGLAIGFSGPPRGAPICSAENCRLEQGHLLCPGVTACQSLTLNTLAHSALTGGVAYITSFPTRRESKNLWAGRISEVVYLSSDGITNDARWYSERRGNPIHYYKFENSPGVISAKRQSVYKPADWCQLVDEIAKLVEALHFPLTLEETGILLVSINACRSKCLKQWAGAVAFDELWRLLGLAYNGSMPGDDNCCDAGCPKDRGAPCVGGHAEQTLSTQVLNVAHLQGSKVFVTLQPCLECTSLLTHAGIREIYHLESYNREPSVNDSSTSEAEQVVELARAAGVQIYRYTENGWIGAY
ncbi:MAG: hypothetical protein WCW17_03015 [Patescibacteria group bacterium]